MGLARDRTCQQARAEHEIIEMSQGAARRQHIQVLDLSALRIADPDSASFV